MFPRAAIIALLATALIIPTTASAIFAPGGETPRNGMCDASGRLVCAGIDVGANGGCTISPTGVASCWWSYGWLSAAWSPAGLSGSEEHVVDVLVEACSSMSGCTVLEFKHVEVDCAWGLADACTDGPGFFPPAMDRQLAMGECLTVTSTLQASISATTPEAGAPLAIASYSMSGSGGAATCYLDDGRG